jgi:hypothetical protein
LFLLWFVGLADSQVFVEAAGQPEAATGGQVPGHVLVADVQVLSQHGAFRVDGAHHGLAHLLQKLRQKDGLHFHAGLGQGVAVRLVFRVFQRQGMQGT